jgi:uncharacterized protein (TIGR03086 family)
MDNKTALLRRAVDETTRLVDGIRPDQLQGATLCEEFTVQQLLDHLVEGTSAFAAGITGDSASPASWKDAGQLLVAAVERPGALDGTVTLPWGAFPGDVVLDQAIMETFTHAADLANATGQTIDDAAAYDDAFEVAKGVITDEWRQPGVFGPEQPAKPGASSVDRLLALAGRKV